MVSFKFKLVFKQPIKTEIRYREIPSRNRDLFLKHPGCWNSSIRIRLVFPVMAGQVQILIKLFRYRQVLVRNATSLYVITGNHNLSYVCQYIYSITSIKTIILSIHSMHVSWALNISVTLRYLNLDGILNHTELIKHTLSYPNR